ncbi:parallel beta-helix domain-containing protein [Pelagibaculum spongiae]|uniref:Right handed beta helix domain-containing protein n=1 Tax=Pelagibaculum spongiae TaxID=2080658 RepID=A0A2V1H4K5_9GAMM|nr:parallel beta-helix domain-containing protein [Pelagibaculum spongiae]PVZ72158.1 hypothetical protein DC094_03855 [Pelagibaculum spongiae]
MPFSIKHFSVSAVALATSLLIGCGSSGSSAEKDVTPPDDQTTIQNIIYLQAGPNLTEDAKTALISATDNTRIVFPAGHHKISDTLTFDGDSDGDGIQVKNITIAGAGMNKTSLDFSESVGSDGLLVQNATNITIEDIGFEEAANNAVKLRSTKGIIIRRARAEWKGELTKDNGAYGFYPVESEDILIEDTYTRGSADAGVYIGQSRNTVVRRNVVQENVAGIEIENTANADVYDNIVTGNTGGVLVFDLPIGNEQYGGKTRIFNNRIYNNNTDNFANVSDYPAGVHIVPPGTGVIVLSAKNVEIFDNYINGHDSTSIAITDFQIAASREEMQSYVDNGVIASGFGPTPRKVYIHDNLITDSGKNPRGDLIVTPKAVFNLIGVTDFPPILYDGLGEMLANQGRSEQFGEPPFAIDGSDNVCATRNNNLEGEPVINGRLYDPQSKSYILVDGQVLPSPSTNTDLLSCELPSIEPTIITINGVAYGCGADDVDSVMCPAVDTTPPDDTTNPDQPDEPQDQASCQLSGEGVNWQALAKSDCPDLSDYRLFENSANPTENANGGEPFELAIPLFTDYATKYRFLFMPSGEQATFQPDETFDFPVGSVLVKTFSLPADTSQRGFEHEQLIETRLLIHRESGWTALPYLWNEGGGSAKLAVAGKSLAKSVVHKGETFDFTYVVPDKNQCKACHQLIPQEGRSKFSPIGPKARNLNFDITINGQTKNQLIHWKDNNLLQGLPDIASITQLPKFNDDITNSEIINMETDQLTAMAKGYLDINCAHCHRSEGDAGNTPLKLPYWLSYDDNKSKHGVCTKPVTYGGGALSFLTIPGDAENSIVHFRMVATSPKDRMPKLGRSLAHTEGVQLIENWINRLPEVNCQ